MKKVIIFLAVFVLTGATMAYAGEGERKGFLIGLGPHIGYEANTFKKVTGGAEFRIGGGFNEEWLLYLEGAFSMTRKSSTNLWVYDTLAKGQWFFYEDAYANLGAGFTEGEADCTIAGAAVTYETKLGFVGSGGFGYEFRLADHFVMAPEIQVHYRRLESKNYIEPMFNLHMGWYF